MPRPSGKPPCTLGESIIGDDRSRRFWWVDVPAGVLYRGEEGGQAPDRWQFPEALGHVALTENPDCVVLGLASGLGTLRRHHRQTHPTGDRPPRRAGHAPERRPL